MSLMVPLRELKSQLHPVESETENRANNYRVEFPEDKKPNNKSVAKFKVVKVEKRMSMIYRKRRAQVLYFCQAMNLFFVCSEQAVKNDVGAM